MRFSINRLLPAAVLSAAAMLATGAVLTAAVPAAASSPIAPLSVVAAVNAEDVGIDVAPDAAGVLLPGQDLTLTVRITNRADAALAAGEVQVAVSEILATPDAVDSWMGGTDLPRVLATLAVPATGARSSSDVRVTIPAATLGLTAWGTYGVAARSTSAANTPSARSAVVYSSGPAPAAASVSTVVPLVVPEQATGLLTAAQLEALLAPDAALGKALAAVAGRPVAIAVDPRIIASVRVLGDAAPLVAREWLDRLAAATNEIFPLQYADADPSIQRDAGMPNLLAPFSFEYAQSSQNQSTTGAAAPRSADSVLDWDYSTQGIVWPGAGTVEEEDLGYFAQSGVQYTIVDSGQIGSAGAERPSTALAEVGDSRILISNRQLSLGLTQAATSDDSFGRDAGLARYGAALAAAVSSAAPGPASLLATLDRGWLDEASTDTAGVLASIAATPWASPATLAALTDAPAAGKVTVLRPTEDPDRIATVSMLFGNEIRVGTFATVVDPPSAVTGRVRNDLLAALSVRYRSHPTEWAEAVTVNTTRTDAVLGSVTVVDSSSINLLSAAADIPITVSNDLAYPVTVLVTVTPSNGRLVVDESVTVTVEADARATARIPVTAGVANGEVILVTRLLTADGVVIAEGTPVTVNVSADWEGIGAVTLAVLISGFFAFSVIRLIVIRRRRRRESTEPDSPLRTGSRS